MNELDTFASLKKRWPHIDHADEMLASEYCQRCQLERLEQRVMELRGMARRGRKEKQYARAINDVHAKFENRLTALLGEEKK